MEAAAKAAEEAAAKEAELKAREQAAAMEAAAKAAEEAVAKEAGLKAREQAAAKSAEEAATVTLQEAAAEEVADTEAERNAAEEAAAMPSPCRMREDLLLCSPTGEETEKLELDEDDDGEEDADDDSQFEAGNAGPGPLTAAPQAGAGAEVSTAALELRSKWSEVPGGKSTSFTLEPPPPLRKAMKLRTNSGRTAKADRPGRMADSVRALWRSQDFCDVDLVCGKTTLRAHKVVLAGQSVVFREILAKRADVQLSEVQHPEAVELMLKYLYEATDESGIPPRVSHEVLRDLLRLASRFQLPGLFRLSAVALGHVVTTRNAVECLVTCGSFGLTVLQHRILDKLAANKEALKEVTGGPAIAEYPDLLQEILRRVAAGPREAAGKGVCQQLPAEKRARRH
jgi:hypothetical protein